MHFIDLQQVELKEFFPGLRARMVHTDKQTFAYWEIDAGAELPAHSHPHQQTSMVTKGEMELTIDGVSQVLRPGMVAVIPSNAVHSGKALTYVEVTDVFFPARDDYR